MFVSTFRVALFPEKSDEAIRLFLYQPRTVLRHKCKKTSLEIDAPCNIFLGHTPKKKVFTLSSVKLSFRFFLEFFGRH